MINAFFLEEEGHPVKELSINQIFLDWKPYTAKMKNAGEYPQAPVVEIVIPCPTQEERREYYFGRLGLHIEHENTPDDELPHCTPEECWANDAKWAVQLKSTGRARKLCDTKEEADVWFLTNIKSGSRALYEVVKRDGNRLKCQEFCSVNSFCNQYQEWKNAN